MKNFSIGLNVLLLVAVIVLFILHFTENGKSGSSSNGMDTPYTQAKIVYINIDTLLSNYIQSKELNEAYLKKVEEKRTELNVRMKQLAKENEEFQRKLDNNGFLTRERANEAYTDLAIKNQNLQRLQQEIQENLAVEQSEINKKLFEVFTQFFTEYNKSKGYEMILSTTVGGTVFYAEKGYDITREVLTQLNERYRKNNNE